MIKKMLSVVLALAMVVSYVPMVKAGDSASLGLQVTFDLGPELKIETDYNGELAVVGEEFRFGLTAQGKNVQLYADQDTMPEGAVLLCYQSMIDPYHTGGTFIWTPNDNQAGDYEVLFKAEGEGQGTVELVVGFTVKEADVIAISLEGPNPWVLENIALGELRTNDGYVGPLHTIKNTGNVPVSVDIGYGPLADVVPLPHPGYEQGLDTFITVVGESVLPPSERLNLDHVINPDMAESLPLKFGAPTALSEPVPGMGVSYEVRAYPVYEPIPPING